MKQYALTTFDNPFCPFTDYKSWFLFDVDHDYNSDSFLARIARTSDELSDDENAAEIERAIDEIIRSDFLNIYKKVSRVIPDVQSEFESVELEIETV